MNDSKTTDLSSFHQAIIDHLKSGLDQNVTVDIYDNAFEGNSIPTPAALIQIAEMGEGQDIGDDRCPLMVGVSVHCVLSTETPDVQLQIRNFAAQVIRLVRRQLFGLAGAVSRPIDLDAMPGAVKEGSDEVPGFESWVVEFNQTLYLGESVWKPEGVTPSRVYIGISPEIGIDHEPEYEQVV